MLALIPARGGSKGIPRKNIYPLRGRPLLAYTVDAARAAKSIARVVVSTDDPEIAEVARRAGAEAPFLRPAVFATDTAPSIAPIKHALAWLREHESYSPEAVALLPPTSPLRGPGIIDAVIDRLFASGSVSAAALRPAANHPYWMLREDGGRLRFLMDVSPRPQRRQDLPTFYVESQAVLVSRTQYIEGASSAAPVVDYTSLTGCEISRREALDIDTLDDLELAETYLKRSSVDTPA